MSYRYGFNGNDVRWEFMPHSWTCLVCEDAIKNGTDAETLECDGHVHKYTFGRGYGYLLHDTNDNFISVRGNVPLDVYSTSYLAEWMAELSYNGVTRWDESLVRRIKRELASDSRRYDAAGYWNGYTDCLYVDDVQAIIRRHNTIYVRDVEYSDDERTFVTFGRKSDPWIYYFDECMRM